MCTGKVVTFLSNDSDGESDRYALGPIGRLRETMRNDLACPEEYSP